jgi:transcriptional regulator with PAS, ATPase and Fis domain
MRRVFALLERAAQSDATVLIEGETGTGKEAVAESIHRESRRSDGPFVVVDCGAIPSALLESELFGHERGAFTGAVAARRGAFEAAAGGTIFLDEIGELDAELQPKLLRVLERKEIKRVGNTQHTAVDVRVIAATNRGLRTEVNAKRFRSDLYYRLAVVEIALPPLRERPEDVPLLVSHLLDHLGAAGTPEAAMLQSEQSLTTLTHHKWPGNVRELRNYVERTVALRDQAPPLVPASASGVEFDLSLPLARAREACVLRFERQYITAILERHGGSVVAAARAAGLDRSHFHRLMARAGVRSGNEG